MNLVNFTPHAVTLLAGGASVTLPPSGGVARVSTCDELADCLSLQAEAFGLDDRESFPVDLFTQSYGEVTGLPEERPGVVLLVSGMVRAALPERMDLASPGGLVREDGRVIGCTHLVVNARQS
jgi:hypothetical protein